MKKQIIAFVNYKYISMSYIDLIFKILGYFAYSYIMIIPTTFVIFDVQKNGFSDVSFSDDRVIPIIVIATVLSGIMGLVSFFVYRYKTKWSVILLRGFSNLYILITLFFLSCFNAFELNAMNICSIIIKLCALAFCILLYKNYLFNKKLPKIEQIIHGQTTNSFLWFLIPAMVVFIRPLLMLLFKDRFTLDFTWLISLGEFLLALSLVVNVVDAFTKTYYAKKYSL